MNKIFKLFSVLVIMVAVIGLTGCILPVSVDANTYYLDTPNEYLDFMRSSTKRYGQLRENITVTEVANVDSIKELDLNGYSITRVSGDGAVIDVKSGGDVTIKDTKPAAQQGKISNNGVGNNCYVLVVRSNGKLKITDGGYEAAKTCIYVGGEAEITTTKNIIGDKDDSDAVVGDGIYIDEGGTITSLNCTHVFGGDSAITNFGIISNIAGGEYEANGSRDLAISNNDYDFICAIYNQGTISQMNGNVVLNATNNGTGKAAGIYNCNTQTTTANYPTITDATKSSWTIYAGSEEADDDNATKAFYIYPVPNQN